MKVSTEPIVPSQSSLWRDRWKRFRARLKSLIPFAAGVSAALLGLLLYNAFNP